MPKAWLVRFGRTVGSQVVGALDARLEGAAGAHVTVGGINVIGTPGIEPQAEDNDPFGLPEWAKNAERSTRPAEARLGLRPLDPYGHLFGSTYRRSWRLSMNPVSTIRDW